MIYKIFIICILILAMIYYASIILQCLFPNTFKIVNDQEISFIKASIPFYYWIAGKKKTSNTSGNSSAMDAVGMNMMLDIVNKMNKK